MQCEVEYKDKHVYEITWTSLDKKDTIKYKILMQRLGSSSESVFLFIDSDDSKMTTNEEYVIWSKSGNELAIMDDETYITLFHDVQEIGHIDLFPDLLI